MIFLCINRNIIQRVYYFEYNDKQFPIRNLKLYEVFSKQKIIYSEIVQDPQFYLDKNGHFYPEATAFIMTGDYLEYILLSLNSKLFSFGFRNFYAGGGLGEKVYRYKKAFLEKLPILIPSENISKEFINLLNYNKYDDANIFIYSLYNLDKKEIEYIEEENKRIEEKLKK